MNKQILTLSVQFTVDDAPSLLAYLTETVHGMEGRVTSHRITEVSGKRAMTAAGFHQGGRVPYGFTTQTNGALVWAYGSPEATTLTWVLKARKGGGTLREVAEQLNDQGVPSPGGKAWSHGIVRRVVEQARAHAHLVPMDQIL